jgi:excisionase family DNA binding protein
VKNVNSAKAQERLLLRPREVADMIGVSRTTAYDLIAAGTIPSVRLGNHLRVPAAALEKLIADGMTKGEHGIELTSAAETDAGSKAAQAGHR